MIGRAAVGNPWLFAAVRAELRGEAGPPLPSRTEIAAVALLHTQMQARLRVEGRAVRTMRPHLARYTAGLPGSKALRVRLMQAESLNEVKHLLVEFAATPPRLPEDHEAHS